MTTFAQKAKKGEKKKIKIWILTRRRNVAGSFARAVVDFLHWSSSFWHC